MYVPKKGSVINSMFDVSPIIVFFVEKMQTFYFDLAQARLTSKIYKAAESSHNVGVSLITIDFIVEEIRVLPIFGYCSSIVDFKALKLQVYMGCHQQYTYHQKVYSMCFILV